MNMKTIINVIRLTLASVALALLFGQVQLSAQDAADRNDKGDQLVLLLKGVYQPVAHAPKLGLTSVDLDDGTYASTNIYSFEDHRTERPEGTFYVNADVSTCAYHLPGGAFAAHFTSFDYQ